MRLARAPETWIAIAMTASTLLLWLGARGDTGMLARYWDGPMFMYVAKTFYDVPEDHPTAALGHPRYVHATRPPLYPATIRLCTLLTGGDYPHAMLLATLLASVAAAIAFHRMLVAFELVASPIYTALLFCVLPPRWLLYHSVGASEPLFFALVFAAFLAYRRERLWTLVLCVGLASLTRVQGILMVPVFGLAYLTRREWGRALAMPVAGIGLVALFGYYQLVYGDFFAYFTVNSGERSMIGWPPFVLVHVFGSKGHPRSAEFMIVLYLLYGVGTLRLWRRRELFAYCAAFFVLHAVVVSKDMSRYFLAMAPFALFVAFDDALRQRAFRLMLPLIVILSYVYAWAVLPKNLMGPDLYRGLLRALQ